MSFDHSAQDLGQCIFDEAAQQLFAHLSGDFNPMHMDAMVARRLQTGRPVVHGVHLLLAALERWPAEGLKAAWRIECEFLNSVSVGERVGFESGLDEGGQPQLLASVNGLPCTRVTFGQAENTPSTLQPMGDAEALVPGLQPLQREPATWVGHQQRMALPLPMDASFAHTCRYLGERSVAAIALLSAYVGMVCPGLHSVFSSLVVEPGSEAAGHLRFEVRRFDARFRLFVIAFDGIVRGEIKAFLRVPAQPQPPMRDLLPLLRADEFGGSRSWVIGGSRGLGELVAKLIGAGGGEVILTYATGAADAQRVVDDIRAAGRANATLCSLDLTHADLQRWVLEREPPDAVWYFATPRIYRKKTGLFDATLFDEFLDFYVRRFEALCTALESAPGTRPVRVFYPSTVFIDERPKGMTEYAMAKAAAEVLIADLGRSLRRVQLLARRLPRLATDQTASLFVAGAGANVEVMLPIVRELLVRG